MVQSIQINLCDMWDAQAPLSGAILIFAILAVVAALAGWLLQSDRSARRIAGGVVLVCIVGLSLNMSAAILRWGGLVWDQAQCITLATWATHSLILTLNIVVGSSAWLAFRWRAGRKRRGVLTGARQPSEE